MCCAAVAANLPECRIITDLPEYTNSVPLSLEWEGSDAFGEPITGYVLVYREDGGEWSVLYEGESTSGSFGSPDITSDHGYDFRCRSKTEQHPDDGAWSPIESTYVDTISPSAAMTSLPEWTNTTNFTVEWTGTDSGSGIESYSVEYRTEGNEWDTWLSRTDSVAAVFGPASPVAVTSGSMYQFRVRARDRAGNAGEYSSETGTTIDTDKPVCKIMEMEEYQTDSKTFTVRWEGSDTGSGVDVYKVQYNFSGQWDCIPGCCNTTSTSKNISGSEGRTYYFRCQAVDNAGNKGEWSEVRFTTVDTEPPEIEAVYNSSITYGDNFTIISTISDGVGIAETYLMYENGTIPGSIENTSDTLWRAVWILSLIHI